MEWVGGNIPVNGHHSEQGSSGISKWMEEVHLKEAASERDGLLTADQVESILGIAAVVYHISRNVKILMGLYMGLWRQVSVLQQRSIGSRL